MKTFPTIRVLSVAVLALAARLHAQPFAVEVISYTAGSGAAVGYNNPLQALGEPARLTGFPSGGDPVHPFNPPWPASQLVSIGAGGSLTVRFANPVLNAADHLFGLDFLIFGNNGFSITNNDFTGGGITDGSLFTFDPPGASRVCVSSDNLSYYELIAPPGLSATVDGLFPTDGSGDFQIPVNQALTGADFAGKDLAGIRALYGGSAGGTGFDLAWARNNLGESVAVDDIRYVRVDVLNGKAEIDAFVAVPEPGAWALLALGAGAFTWALRRRRA